MNSGTLLSFKGLGLCPQGEEQVLCEKLGGKLTTVCLEQKCGFAFVCADWDPLATEITFSFCLYITFLKAWNGKLQRLSMIIKISVQNYCE